MLKLKKKNHQNMLEQQLWVELKKLGWQGPSQFFHPYAHFKNVWHWAITANSFRGQKKALFLLLENAPRPQLKDNQDSLLLLAALYNQDLIRDLMEMGEDINEKDKYGNTLLSIGLNGLNKTPSLEGFNQLLEYDLDLSPNLNQQTPLLWASEFADFDLFKKILDKSKDEWINLKDKYGNSPLSSAYQEDFASNKMIKMISLIKRGADPNTKIPGMQKSIFFHALEKNKNEIAKILIKAGADPWICARLENPNLSGFEQIDLFKQLKKIRRKNGEILPGLYLNEDVELDNQIENWIIETEKKILDNQLPKHDFLKKKHL